MPCGQTWSGKIGLTATPKRKDNSINDAVANLGTDIGQAFAGF